MKRFLFLLLMVVILLSLTACSKKDAPKDVNTVPQKVEEQAPVKPDDDYSEIKQCFSSIGDEWQVKAHKVDKRLEIVVIASGLSFDAAPENWQDILSSMEAALEEAKPLVESAGFSMFSAQIELEDGTILTSGYNGSIKFDKFNQVSIQQNEKNPPTISKFEYDQITVGMSLSQVNDIIGGSGTLESSVGTAGVTSVTRTYTWQGDNGGYASVLFDNYEVYYKIEVGLS